MYILASNMNAFYGRGYGSGYYMFDWTYLLVLIGLALSLIASANVKNTFNHYAKIRSRSNLTGAMAAERVLHRAGIDDVSIQRVAGNLTDHYDPRSKTLRLSDRATGTASIAAVCVAAHECGHAVQDQSSTARWFCVVPWCRWQILAPHFPGRYFLQGSFFQFLRF